MAPELGDCIVGVVGRVVVRSLEAADTVAVADTAAAVEVDSSGLEEVQEEVAGNAAGLLAGDPVAGVAGVDPAGGYREAGRTATRAAEEAAGSAAPSGEDATGDLAAVVAELAEVQEGEEGNTAPPELGSGAPQSWTWFLQLLTPYSILQRQFDETIVDCLSVEVM